MTERSVDRAAWAHVVAKLIAQETGGNTSKFANLVGVTYKTVRRWVNEEATVSEESVRQVARAVGRSPRGLLVAVGYYRPEELDTTAEPAPDASDDKALQLILDADVAPRVKQRMIQRLHQLRAQESERQVDEVRWWIDQARGA